MPHPREFFLFTSSTPSTTLFSDHSEASRRRASLLVSAVVHVVVVGLVFFGIIAVPPPVRVVTEKFDVRHLELYAPDMQRAAQGKPSAATHKIEKPAQTASGHTPAALRQAVHAEQGPQTLLQPDLPKQTASVEPIPVPEVMIWTPQEKPTNMVVAPTPVPPATAQVKPSVDIPIPTVDLSNIEIATKSVETPKLPVSASSTTPIVVQAASKAEVPPSTTAQQTQTPTPTAILSISDLRMKDGSVTLPPVNQSVHDSAPGTLNGSTDEASIGQGVGKGNGTGSGNSEAGTRGTTGTANGAGSGQGNLNGDGSAFPLTTTQITLPRDGKFGSIIVGQSVAEQFPEMIDLWSGRMAYTVYLHVGQARSWILQYSLPHNDDAAAAGSAGKLDAPWPYSIVRPNLTAEEVESDALMVHGFVDKSGHFEDLSMVFPRSCPQAPFVLKSLEQWQFRPALQNGQVAKVEVLLIIPEEFQ